MGISFKPYLKPLPGKEPDAPTAVLIVKSYDGLAVHSLLNITRLFANYFKNIVFVSVGVVNTNTFSAAEVQNLQRSKEENIKSLVQYARFPTSRTSRSGARHSTPTHAPTASSAISSKSSTRSTRAARPGCHPRTSRSPHGEPRPAVAGSERP